MKNVNKISNEMTELDCFEPNPTDLSTLDDQFIRYYFNVRMGKQLIGLIIDLSKNLYPKNSDFETFSELLQKRESVDKKIFKLIVLQTYDNFPHYLENMKTYSIAGIYCWSGKYGSNFKFDNCRHAKFDVNESNVTFLKTNSLQGDQLEEGKDFRNPRFYSIDSHEKLMDDISSLNRGNPNNIYWSRVCKETN